MQPQKADLIIIGQGIAGQLAYKKISAAFPGMKIVAFDKGKSQEHSFHLHRPIPLPGLQDIKPVRMKVNIFDGDAFKITPTIEDINEYAFKIFGRLQITNIFNLADQDIYPISKGEINKALENGITIEEEVDHIEQGTKILTTKQGGLWHYRYLLSTTPLPIMLKLFRMEHNIKFDSHPFYAETIDLGYDSNLHEMVQISSQGYNINRATLLNNKLHVESIKEEYKEIDKRFIQQTFGVDTAKLNIISPGRITPLPQDIRKPLLHWLTERHDIFTLGRYGAWTFKVANDVWDDLDKTIGLIQAKEQACKFK